VSFRLRNENDPGRIVRMNNWTWFDILDLAFKHGWNPRGTVTPERLELAGFVNPKEEIWSGEYWGNQARLVLLEDALNLAEALEQAFIQLEPVRLPSLHPFYLGLANGESNGRPPAVGVIQILIRFCQQGAFLIEAI
jgi:hypothetical protein